jgi:phosphatidylglycerol---prolipoprotein diacylglyceryl transferase
VLWLYSRKPRAAGAVSALFLIVYGASRFVVEYSREPDSFLGVLALGLTMGQWLSLPMVIAGAWLLWRSARQPVAAAMPVGPEAQRKPGKSRKR